MVEIHKGLKKLRNIFAVALALAPALIGCEWKAYPDINILTLDCNGNSINITSDLQGSEKGEISNGSVRVKTTVKTGQKYGVGGKFVKIGPDSVSLETYTYPYAPSAPDQVTTSPSGGLSFVIDGVVYTTTLQSGINPNREMEVDASCPVSK